MEELDKLGKSDIKALIGLGLIGLFCLFIGWRGYSCYDELRKEAIETNYCGTVISKPTEERTIKHGTQTELYLRVQFDAGFTRSIETNVNTYDSKEVGSRVCFNLTEHEAGLKQSRESTFFDFCCMIVVAFALAVGSLILLVFLCMHFYKFFFNQDYEIWS